MASSTPAHWDAVYTRTPTRQLGWYEPQPEPSLELIQRCELAPDAALIDVGCGASTLLAALLNAGFRRVHALDFSPVALATARAALESSQVEQIEWLLTDITGPADLPAVDLWHDRAVFHFMTTVQERQTYFANLRQALRPGGYLIMAAFATGGARQCSGLPVINYDAPGLARQLGPGFMLIESQDYLYTMPSGDVRPYIYARFQKLA